MRRALLTALIMAILTACARQPVKPPGPLQPPVPAPPPRPETWDKVEPSLARCDWIGFESALETVIPALEKDPEKTFSAVGRSWSAGALAARLRKIKGQIAKDPGAESPAAILAGNFDILELSSPENKAFFTAYYVPEFEARRREDAKFRYPLFSPPDDLLTVKLFALGPDFRKASFRGRINERRELVPYFTRQKIDGENVLKGKNLEIAYLKDPLDIMLLQIQGSGRLVFDDGSARLAAYAGKNGHPYMSIGRYMADNAMLPIEEVSWDNIRSYLREHPEKLQEVLFSNPSYVFFRLKEAGAATGSLGLPLTPLHSIAVDNRHVPPLSLCLMDLRKPVIGDDGLVKAFAPLTEPAFAMDEGSAIRGPARVDIFLGSGAAAERLAGAMKGEGSLYLLIPKAEQDSTP